MKIEEGLGRKTCPKCGKEYHGVPAISRTDNTTAICPECGTREALESLGIGKDEQDHIVGLIAAQRRG